MSAPAESGLPCKPTKNPSLATGGIERSPNDDEKLKPKLKILANAQSYQN